MRRLVFNRILTLGTISPGSLARNGVGRASTRNRPGFENTVRKLVEARWAIRIRKAKMIIW